MYAIHGGIMKKYKALAILSLLVPLTSCDIFVGTSSTPSPTSPTTSPDSTVIGDAKLEITSGLEVHLNVGQDFQIQAKATNTTDKIVYSIESEIERTHVTVSDTGLVKALKAGVANILVSCGILNKTVKVTVDPEASFELTVSSKSLKVGETASLTVSTSANYSYFVKGNSKCVSISGNVLTAKREGTAEIYAKLANGSEVSNTVVISISDFVSNPYLSIDEDEFYSDYYTATSYKDAQYRTEANLMSGDIDEQDQAPTINSNRPIDGDKYVKNSTNLYNSNKTAYTVVDSDGNEVKTIYKGGAYATLEDVAAYIHAFADIPSNYTESKSAKPTSSPWGKWLRLNNSFFSGSTTNYPYEPELPDISGVGNGQTKYYEIDIGTTGTDCDPKYDAVDYNNGSKITRGAARIVYTRTDLNGNELTDFSKRHVFYTYNHYNDFQEYLNYYNGWGEMFGNVTGGGTLSSKEDYNPTPYVPVSFRSLI